MCTVDKEFGYFNQLVGYLICMHANLIRYMPACIHNTAVFKGN